MPDAINQLHNMRLERDHYRAALEKIAESAPVSLPEIHPACRLPNIAREALKFSLND